MQIQKEDIKVKILEIAQKEFLEKGFKDTSMRIIAQKANVGLSNIYNYFKNKDEIFTETLAPLTKALQQLMDEHNSPENLTLEFFNSEEYRLESMKKHLEIILNYKKELKLLLFKSHGSTLEGFRDEYINRHTKQGIAYLREMKKKYTHLNTNISEFFIHTVSSWWFSIIGEIVSHDLSNEEIKKFISEYIEFCTAGWEKMMKVKNEKDAIEMKKKYKS